MQKVSSLLPTLALVAIAFIGGQAHAQDNRPQGLHRCETIGLSWEERDRVCAAEDKPAVNCEEAQDRKGELAAEIAALEQILVDLAAKEALAEENLEYWQSEVDNRLAEASGGSPEQAWSIFSELVAATLIETGSTNWDLSWDGYPLAALQEDDAAITEAADYVDMWFSDLAGTGNSPEDELRIAANGAQHFIQAAREALQRSLSRLRERRDWERFPEQIEALLEALDTYARWIDIYNKNRTAINWWEEELAKLQAEMDRLSAACDQQVAGAAGGSGDDSEGADESGNESPGADTIPTTGQSQAGSGGGSGSSGGGSDSEIENLIPVMVEGMAQDLRRVTELMDGARSHFEKNVFPSAGIFVHGLQDELPLPVAEVLRQQALEGMAGVERLVERAEAAWGQALVSLAAFSPAAEDIAREQAIPALTGSLKDHEPGIRAAALGSMARLEPASARTLDALVAGAGDTSAEVRRAAAEELARYVEQGGDAPLRLHDAFSSASPDSPNFGVIQDVEMASAKKGSAQLQLALADGISAPQRWYVTPSGSSPAHSVAEGANGSLAPVPVQPGSYDVYYAQEYATSDRPMRIASGVTVGADETAQVRISSGVTLEVDDRVPELSTGYGWWGA
ncbi:MAG: HEAT repeat domain-containing protein, partial [Proteobacteria bacterium]|nr:HEAT repeat domain-containing protein [Pseudomonadota bacterium]